jgi:hypothetical protein
MHYALRLIGHRHPSILVLAPELPRRALGLIFAAKITEERPYCACPISNMPKAAVLNSLTSSDTQHIVYAIDEFVDWYCSDSVLHLIGMAGWRRLQWPP